MRGNWIAINRLKSSPTARTTVPPLAKSRTNPPVVSITVGGAASVGPGMSKSTRTTPAFRASPVRVSHSYVLFINVFNNFCYLCCQSAAHTSTSGTVGQIASQPALTIRIPLPIATANTSAKEAVSVTMVLLEICLKTVYVFPSISAVSFLL